MKKRQLIPIIYIAFLMLPIYWLVAMSFKTTNEILSGFSLFLQTFTFANYAVIFTDPTWYWGYINSILYVSINTVMERVRELACDQQVLRRKGITSAEYGACLVRVCRRVLRDDRRLQIAMPSVALVNCCDARATGFLRLRVQQLLDVPAGADRVGVAALVLVAVSFAIAFSALSLQRSADWSQDRLMLSAIVNLERMSQRNGLAQR